MSLRNGRRWNLPVVLLVGNILNHLSLGEPGNNQLGDPAPEAIDSVTVNGTKWEMVGHLTF
jgi:hypothetical protein